LKYIGTKTGGVIETRPLGMFPPAPFAVARDVAPAPYSASTGADSPIKKAGTFVFSERS